MKNSILTIVLGLLFSSLSFAQLVTINENPKSSWPFYFRDFVPAQVYFHSNNNALTEAKVNINLFTGELQYIDNSNTIRILDNTEDIKSVHINEDFNFIFVDGFFQKVIAQSGNKYTMTKRTKGLLADLEDNSGAYGTSTTTSAVDKINDKLIGGLNVFSYPSVVETRNSGIAFDPEIKYFFVSGDKSFILSKKNLKQAFTEAQSKKIFSFMKKEKIKLKDESDITLLLDYITSL